jgi:hypothetical protein
VSEALYDEKIAPMLAEVSRICKERDLPMLAVVEYEPGSFGETACQTPSQHMAMSMAHMASRCRGNLDSLVLSILRFCKSKGIDTSASFVANQFSSRTAGVSTKDGETVSRQTLMPPEKQG